MKVRVENEGDKTIRVIVDGDNVDDQQLPAGETIALESRDEGTIELRELDT
jgi:hypothetical protein